MDKFHEECAVVGVIGHAEAAKLCYLSLYAMQHRGQEGSGIVSTDGKDIYLHRSMGLVSDVYNSNLLSELNGDLAIGHNRYATCGSKNKQNLQPLLANFGENSFAIAHNGNLVNADELRVDLKGRGAIFQTTSDTEVILHLMAQAVEQESIAGKMLWAVGQVEGAYSVVVIGMDRLLAVRDPFGVRPLALGKVDGAYVVASESCAFDLLGAEFIRDISPGELIEITKGEEPKSYRLRRQETPAKCIFEYVYFARPDSNLDKKNVYLVRQALGRELAREHPVAGADMVIPVPDSGVPAALGFSHESGIPMEFGLIRNHYVGRTFIEPKQSIRNFGVRVKLNANPALLAGRRIVVVDDSIVRGTTSQKLVAMLRAAGALEVHMRISSPPTIRPCFYGIDTPSKDELIAAAHSCEEIRAYLGADSLGYLSNEGMFRAVGDDRAHYCDACFSGEYRAGIMKRERVTSNHRVCAIE